MKLGDKIRLHYEKKPLFVDGKPEVVDGEFTVIGVSYGLSHCFSEDMWSQGFNSFEYGEHRPDRPDIFSIGSIYVPTPQYLDERIVKDLNYDSKTVSWEILPPDTSTELSQRLPQTKKPTQTKGER